MTDALSDRLDFCNVGLTGGVFQNARLVAEIVDMMKHRPHPLRLHKHLPCNDGAISFGQVVEYAALKNVEQT